MPQSSLQGTGTCHQWTVDLSDSARESVNSIKTTVQDFIMTTEDVEAKRRVLTWNDGMDELYLSAPKHNRGSDKVFVLLLFVLLLFVLLLVSHSGTVQKPAAPKPLVSAESKTLFSCPVIASEFFSSQ